MMSCFTDLKSLSHLFQLLESFCKSTQLEVNIDKSMVMTNNSIVGFDSLAPMKQVKNLGITHYLNERIDVNYANSIENKIKEIESRKMSWRAKAINLEIFAGSKIYFPLRHQIVSNEMVEKLQKAFTNCIWGPPKARNKTKCTSSAINPRRNRPTKHTENLHRKAL